MIKVHQSVVLSRQLSLLVEKLNKFEMFHDFEIFTAESCSAYRTNLGGTQQLFTESNAAFAIHANYEKHDLLYYGGLGALLARSKFLGIFLAGGEKTPVQKIQIFLPQKTLNCPAFCAKLVYTLIMYFERRFSDRNSFGSDVSKIKYPAGLKYNGSSSFSLGNISGDEPYPYYITWDDYIANPMSVV